MKGTIASLIVLALELSLCLMSSHWGSVDVDDSQICFKNIFGRFNVSLSEHRHLRVGPMYASRFPKLGNAVEHVSPGHAKTEVALIVIGIFLMITSALTLSFIEFCSSKSIFYRYRVWFHLLNVVLLTISVIVLIVGFHVLQHTLQQPFNGIAAIGFYVGILFEVILATHSAIVFWVHLSEINNKKASENIEL